MYFPAKRSKLSDRLLAAGGCTCRPHFIECTIFCLVIVCIGKTDSKRWTFLVESKAKSLIVLIVIYRQMFDKIADWSWLCYHDLICLVKFTFLVSRKNHIPLFSSIRLSGKDTFIFSLQLSTICCFVLLFLSRRTLRCAANEQNECKPSARRVPPIMYVLHTWQEQTFDKLVDCSRLKGLVLS